MNQSEYEEAFRTQAARVQRTVARLVAAPEAVIEEACSFGWMQAWRYRDTLDADVNLVRAWVVRVAQREAWVRATEETASVADIGDSEAIAATRDDFAAREQRLQALDMIGNVSPFQARVLTLYAAGYRYEEIAELLDISVGAVNKALVRAKTVLRKRAE